MKYQIDELQVDVERLTAERDGAFAEMRKRGEENAKLRTALKAIDAQSIATTEPHYVAVPAKLIADAILSLDT